MPATTYSVSRCQKILDETAPLLRLYHRTYSDLQRIEVLIGEHFQTTILGEEFRSICCYGVPGHPVSLDVFNELCILPATEYCVQLSVDESTSLVCATALAPEETQKYLQDFNTTTNNVIYHVFRDIANNHSRKVDINSFIPDDGGIPLTWSLAIVGSLEKRKKFSLPPLSVLRERINISITKTFEARTKEPLLRFFCKETGALWQSAVDDSFSAEEIYLKAGSEFKGLLQILLDESGKTLDQLAGVEISKRYPEVEEVVRAGFEGAKLKGMESIDLKREDGTLGGTVLAMHNEGFLSIEWIAAYLVDTDQNHFMVDERARTRNNKERYLRVFSAIHDFKNPTWLQFGKKNGVYLYLSERATAAEEGWLRIVSYVINLLIDDINKRLDTDTGFRYRLEQVTYDCAAASLSDPSTGSFARHQDGFNGLIAYQQRGYGRLNLVVPTMSFQNHCAPTSTISWYRKDDKTGPSVGSFVHDFFIQHWQLLGANLHFEHEVTSTLKGDVEPKYLLNFQLVEKSGLSNGPTSEETQVVASLLHPNYNDSDAESLSFSDQIIGQRQNDLGAGGDLSTTKKLSFLAKRISYSARRTGRLQAEGLVSLHQQFLKKAVTNDPIIHGYEEHYNIMGVWSSTGFGSRSRLPIVEDLSDLPLSRVRTLSRLLRIPSAPVLEPPLLPVPPFEFKKYCYARRVKDKSYWPASNTNAICSRKSLAETLTYGPVLKRLAADGVIPVVCFPCKKNPGQTMKVPFGPNLDPNTNNPNKPGTRYAASAIYKLLRMKNAKEHHDAWHADFWKANSINLRLPSKSALPINLPIIEGRSPLGELQRIDAGLERLGCDFHGSGGGNVINGLAPPDPKSKKTASKHAAVGATFETSQTCLNKMNLVMEQICESIRVVSLYLSGDMLPKKYYDKELEKEIGIGTEQSVEMGMYDVEWCAQTTPLSAADLVAIQKYYDEEYLDLRSNQLRFLFATSKKFRLVPNTYYNDRPRGFQHVHVDIREDRKPFYQVQKGRSIDSVFSGFDDSSLVTESKLLVDWADGRGYLELVETPYEPLNPDEAGDSLEGEDVVANTVLQQFEAKLRPYDIDAAEKRIVSDMAHRRRRTQSVQDHLDVLILCSLGAFARLCLLNVDTEEKIGPLIDYVPSCHGVGSSNILANYVGIFGSGSGLSRYLSRLGRAVTTSPTTHPIRTYDPKVLLLMRCNGGAAHRKLRKGRIWMTANVEASTQLFFHSILIEVVKVEVLVEWSLGRYGSEKSSLPTLSEIPSFLDFIKAVVRANGSSSTKCVLHDQYEFNDNFGQPDIFAQFFRHVQTGLSPWLLRQLSHDVESTQDLFGHTNKMLANFINLQMAEAHSKQAFHCQHMLLNYNEVVDCSPFGQPLTPIVGFGGGFGAQLLQDKDFKPNDSRMVGEVMNRLLVQYRGQSASHLLMLGLKKKGDGSVVVAVNDRPLCVCDPEHGCCMQYPVLERAAGGSKGMSNVPNLVSSHCHPIRGCNFNDGLALGKKALTHFKVLVDKKKWKGPEAKDSESEDESELEAERYSEEELEEELDSCHLPDPDLEHSEGVKANSDAEIKDPSSTSSSDDSSEDEQEDSISSSDSSSSDSSSSDSSKDEQELFDEEVNESKSSEDKDGEEFIRANTPMPQETRGKSGDITKCANTSQGVVSGSPAVRKRRGRFLPTQRGKISSTELGQSKRGSTSTWSSTWAQGLALSEASAVTWARGLPTAEPKAGDQKTPPNK